MLFRSEIHGGRDRQSASSAALNREIQLNTLSNTVDTTQFQVGNNSINLESLYNNGTLDNMGIQDLQTSLHVLGIPVSHGDMQAGESRLRNVLFSYLRTVPYRLRYLIQTGSNRHLSWRNEEFLARDRNGIIGLGTTSWFWSPIMVDAAICVINPSATSQMPRPLDLQQDGAMFNIQDLSRAVIALYTSEPMFPAGRSFLYSYVDHFTLIPSQGNVIYATEIAKNSLVQYLNAYHHSLYVAIQRWFDCLYAN